MREYYDLWDRFSAQLSLEGTDQGARAARAHPPRRPLPADAQRHAAVRASRARCSARLAIWPSSVRRCCTRRRRRAPYRCDGYGDYIFMVSRLTPLKRADLVARGAGAAGGAPASAAVIAGEGEGADRAASAGSRGSASATACTLAGRLDEAALVDHLARCRAVCFPPFDEDYGFVTAEAFASAKAVITCRDSGGPAELVRDDGYGLVCEPDAAVARRARCARVADDRACAERMGAAGARRRRRAQLAGRRAATALTA